MEIESTPESKPRLRPLEAIRVEQDGEPAFCLRDPNGDSEEVIFVPEATMWVLARLDGTRELSDIQAEICRASGEIVPLDALEQLVAKLESASFLDSEAFREKKRKSEEEFAASKTRPATLAGKSYSDDPEVLAAWIDLIVGSNEPATTKTVRAVVAPHIDPQRGAQVYGSAYRAVRGSSAERIVVLGISHMGGMLPYATIAKDFETVFGLCEVDHEFLDRLHDDLPFDPTTEAQLHRREHSIEFQALFLRHLLDDWDQRKIVPILCAFPYLPAGGEQALPYPGSFRKAFTDRLAELIDEKTLIVAGVDFAHVGKRFGDTGDGIETRRSEIEAFDREMMGLLSDQDLDGFESLIDRSRDSYRICGYPALVTLMEILQDAKGEVLDYGQSVEEQTDSLVSFGAMAYR